MSSTLTDALDGLSYTPSPVDRQIGGVPLTKAEGERYQDLANTYADQEIEKLSRSPRWRTASPTQRLQLVKNAERDGHERARLEIGRSISSTEARRRKQEAVGAR